MIRPWYRSRLFWFGLTGVAFLLGTWWDSGAHYSTVIAEAPTEGLEIRLDVSRGWLAGSWKSGGVPLSFSPWVFGATHWPVGRDDELTMLRPRQFDFAPGVSFRKEADWEVINNPMAASIHPYSQWKIQVAFWLLVLGYLLVGILLIGGWQRRKTRLLKASGSPPP